MIRINLLPRAKDSAWRPAIAKRGSAGVALIVVSTALVMAWWFWSLRAASRQVSEDLARVEAEIVRLEPAVTLVRQLESRHTHLQQRVALAEKLGDGHFAPGRVLQEVTDAVPAGLWLIELSYRDHQLTMRGGAASLREVSDLVANLDASRLFRQPVEILDTDRTATDGASGTVLFAVKATVNQ